MPHLLLTKATPVEDIVGRYGPTWREGVISEHLDLIDPQRVRTTGRRTWVVLDSGKAVPVVCSELVWIDTEDGRIDGRCGQPTVTECFCEAHAGLYDPEGATS